MNDQSYRKFSDDDFDTSSSNPTYFSPVQRDPDLKIKVNAKRTKTLAIVELAFSLLILIFGIITMVLDHSYDFHCYNFVSAEIWAPCFGIITAGLGIGALRNGQYGNGCLLISHFVMCILSSIAFGVLIIFGGANAASESYSIEYHSFDDPYSNDAMIPVSRAMLAFQIMICLCAAANMVANIVSTAFICRYWCGRSKGGATTVVYIPTQGAGGNGPMQGIKLPPGAQVVLLPMNANNPESI